MRIKVVLAAVAVLVTTGCVGPVASVTASQDQLSQCRQFVKDADAMIELTTQALDIAGEGLRSTDDADRLYELIIEMNGLNDKIVPARAAYDASKAGCTS